jgi:hypothetical protein
MNSSFALTFHALHEKGLDSGGVETFRNYSERGSESLGEMGCKRGERGIFVHSVARRVSRRPDSTDNHIGSFDEGCGMGGVLLD